MQQLDPVAQGFEIRSFFPLLGEELAGIDLHRVCLGHPCSGQLTGSIWCQINSSARYQLNTGRGVVRQHVAPLDVQRQLIGAVQTVLERPCALRQRGYCAWRRTSLLPRR